MYGIFLKLSECYSMSQTVKHKNWHLFLSKFIVIQNILIIFFDSFDDAGELDGAEGQLRQGGDELRVDHLSLQRNVAQIKAD